MPEMGEDTFVRLRLSGGGGSYILLPVLTTAQRDALSAETGKLIYNSTTGQLENYNGSSWVAVGKVYGDATFLPLAGGALTGDVTMAALKTIDTMDQSVHAADFDAHHYPPLSEPKVGDYYIPLGWLNQGSGSRDATYRYYLPLWLPVAMTFDRIGTLVSGAAAAGKRAILGVYKHTNGFVGDLQFDAGTVLIDSTGLQLATISQQLAAGQWWVVVQNEAAATVELQAPGACIPSITTPVTNAIRGYMDLVAFSATLPTTPAVTSADMVAYTPIQPFLRVASIP